MSKDHLDKERRIDPEDRMGIDFHVARAVERFRKIDNYGDKRNAIQEASSEGQFREGDVMLCGINFSGCLIDLRVN